MAGEVGLEDAGSQLSGGGGDRLALEESAKSSSPSSSEGPSVVDSLPDERESLRTDDQRWELLNGPEVGRFKLGDQINY